MADRSKRDRGCGKAPGDEKILAVGLQRRPANRVKDGLRSSPAPALGFRARANRKDSLVIPVMAKNRLLDFAEEACQIKVEAAERYERHTAKHYCCGATSPLRNVPSDGRRLTSFACEHRMDFNEKSKTHRDSSATKEKGG